MEVSLDSPPAFLDFGSLKATNPRLKTMVALGGPRADSSRFSRMSQSSLLRSEFVQSVIEFLRKHRLDGLELAWLNPGIGAGRSSLDRKNYEKLIKVKKKKKSFELGHI